MLSVVNAVKCFEVVRFVLCELKEGYDLRPGQNMCESMFFSNTIGNIGPYNLIPSKY